LTSAEVWTRHRKLCKKRASAKWYLKKKQHEKEAERLRHLEWRRETREERRLACPRIFTWEMAAYHRVVLAHHFFGYPPRPDAVSVWLWDAWKDDTQQEIEALEDARPHWQWSEPVRIHMRRAAMQERYRPESILGDAGLRFRHLWQSRCVFSSPAGYIWARLAVHGLVCEWTRWIHRIHATYPHRSRHITQIHTPITTNGHTIMPTTTPEINSEWDGLIADFDEWLATQIVRKEDVLDPETDDEDMNTSRDCSTPSSLDSLLIQDCFRSNPFPSDYSDIEEDAADSASDQCPAGPEGGPRGKTAPITIQHQSTTTTTITTSVVESYSQWPANVPPRNQPQLSTPFSTAAYPYPPSQ
jgi:hypothetical protein